MSRLCAHRRIEDDAQCVINTHDATVPHAYTRAVDERLYLLNSLAETFKGHEEWVAYHHIRAVAHGLGFHLTSCSMGLRAVPYARREDGEVRS